MTKQELLLKLNELKKEPDWEDAHLQADSLLLQYINDAEIEKAFLIINKFYA